MNADFIAHMRSLRETLTPLATEFGVPTVRSLILERRTGSTTEYTEIKHLVYSHVDPRLGAAFQSAEGITLEIDDLQIKGISRRHPHETNTLGGYTRDQLVGSGLTYIVDGILTRNGDTVTIANGYRADFVALREASNLTWDLILRRKPDSRKQPNSR